MPTAMTIDGGAPYAASNESKQDQASKLGKQRRKRLETSNLLVLLPKLEAKAAKLREKELRARSKAEEVERQILGIRLVTGTPFSDLRHDNGVGAAGSRAIHGVYAIRRLLTESPSRVWSAGSLHAELEARGWLSPTARHRLQGTEAAISRLVRKGELERLDRGRYRLSDSAASNGDSLPAPVPAHRLPRRARGDR